ncbi:MAG: hypothetical protein DRR42_03700 [Gammaproteobacteria bacterium]|nr:MAG: hypothetical protein DRR42_03700 [Gammaproteobacteria bacterium]
MHFIGIKTKKLVPSVIMLIFLVLIIFLVWQTKQHKTLTNANSARRAGMPIPVEIHKIARGKLNFFIPVECTSKASAVIPMYSLNRYNEIVKNTFVKINDQVKKGQLLVELDADVESLALLTAANELEWLTKEADEGYKAYMDWAKRNLAKGYGIEREYQQRRIEWLHASTLVEMAKLNVKLKQKQMELKKISAPAGGIIVDIALPGQVTIDNEVSLVTLAVVDPIILECQISEEKLNFIKPGLDADVSFYSNTTKIYNGKIAYIKPIADAELRSISIVIELPNADAKLLPGLHSIAQILNPKTSIRIPNIAMIAGVSIGEAQVFVIDTEKKAHIKSIKTGAYADGHTEVKSGLQIGDQVVIAGQFDLRDNDTVRIVSEPNAENVD